MAEVVQGTKQAHHVAELLVRTAVQQTLARVCADHPLDYTTLVAKYEAEVVESCCTASRSTEARCEAFTQKGKGPQCSRRAAIGGFCGLHLDQWEARVACSQRIEAYVGGMPKAEAARAARVPMTAPASIRELL